MERRQVGGAFISPITPSPCFWALFTSGPPRALPRPRALPCKPFQSHLSPPLSEQAPWQVWREFWGPDHAHLGSSNLPTKNILVWGTVPGDRPLLQDWWGTAGSDAQAPGTDQSCLLKLNQPYVDKAEPRKGIPELLEGLLCPPVTQIVPPVSVHLWVWLFVPRKLTSPLKVADLFSVYSLLIPLWLTQVVPMSVFLLIQVHGLCQCGGPTLTRPHTLLHKLPNWA